MKFVKFIAAAALAFGMSSAASADTLDFGSLGSGNLGTATANLPEATITASGNGTTLFVGAAAIDDEICSLDASAFNCEGDLEIDFTSDVNDLEFTVFGFDSGDFVALSVFDGSDGLLTSLNITGNGLIDLSAFTGIGRLFFEDSSTGAGFAYGEFFFNQTQVVPIPAALPLLLTALAGLFGLKYRAKRQLA